MSLPLADDGMDQQLLSEKALEDEVDVDEDDLNQQSFISDSSGEDSVVDVDDVEICSGLSLRYYNVLLLSISLMLIFTAFNTTQSWVTNLLSTLDFPDLGNLSLTVLYSAVFASLLITPHMVHFLSEIRSIVLGSACYVVYMASLIHIFPVLVLFASAVNGFGASILWVAVGGLLTKCSTHQNKGLVTGIFWSIFQLSMIIGNIIAYFVALQSDYFLLFLIFSILAAVGTGLLCCLKKFPSEILAEKQNRTATINRTAIVASPSIKQLFLSVWQLLFSSSLLLLVPSFIFQGIEFSFWNGEFPQLFSTDKLGIILLWCGVGEAVGGASIGYLSDLIGRSLTWLLGSLVFSLGLTGLYLIKQDVQLANNVQISEVSLMGYVAAFCFGLADSAFNTQIYAILGNKYKRQQRPSTATSTSENSRSSHSNSTTENSPVVDDSSATPVLSADIQVVAAFTCFNFMQNIGAAFGFFYQTLFPVHGSSGTNIQLYVNIWLMVIGAAGFIACDRDYIDKYKQ